MNRGLHFRYGEPSVLYPGGTEPHPELNKIPKPS